MNTGKVVANAGSHRIMQALAAGPRTSKELKIVAGAINSVSRFDGEYMARLESNGFVRRHDERWALTKRGHEKLEELGPAHGQRDRKARSIELQAVLERSLYNPAVHNPTRPGRPGSEKFLEYPSRIGQTLYYRDGRIEQLGETDGY